MISLGEGEMQKKMKRKATTRVEKETRKKRHQLKLTHRKSSYLFQNIHDYTQANIYLSVSDDDDDDDSDNSNGWLDG